MLLEEPKCLNCKQIREAMCAYIEKENLKLGSATPYVIEEKPVWRQEQQRTFGKRLVWLSITQRRLENIFLESGTHSIK